MTLANRGRKLGFKCTDAMKQHQREIRLGKSLTELGHKKDCLCCICRAKRHESSGPCSEETKLKISRTKLGSSHSEESKDKNRQAHLGKKNSPESNRKRSEAQRGIHKPAVSLALKGRTYEEIYGEEKAKEMRLKRRGENNGMWTGGLNEEYDKAFYLLRSAIREDYVICQICSKTKEANGEELSVHHIDYDKGNSSIDNLTLLCRSCHTRTNTNREYWQNYFDVEVHNVCI